MCLGTPRTATIDDTSVARGLPQGLTAAPAGPSAHAGSSPGLAALSRRDPLSGLGGQHRLMEGVMDGKMGLGTPRTTTIGA